MISPDENGDLKAAAEEEKRYCQSELEQLNERRRQVLIDLGAAVVEHEKLNLAFWADYPAESKALSDIEDQLDVLEARIADAEKAIEQENNRKESDQIKNSPWTKVCSCGAACPALAKFCPSCGSRFSAEGDSIPVIVPSVVLAAQCPTCRKIYSDEFRFCEICGVELEEVGVDSAKIGTYGEELPSRQQEELPSQQQDLLQETATEEKVFCPQCGTPNKSQAKFCGNCGTLLNR